MSNGNSRANIGYREKDIWEKHGETVVRYTGLDGFRTRGGNMEMKGKRKSRKSGGEIFKMDTRGGLKNTRVYDKRGDEEGIR